MQDSIEILFPLDEIPNIGSMSLAGKIVEAILARGEGFFSPKNVTLLFETTGTGWKEENEGPYMMEIPEFTIPCLIQDILSLVRQGVHVDIKYYDSPERY